MMVEQFQTLIRFYSDLLLRLLSLQYVIAFAHATNSNQVFGNNIVGLWSNAGGLTVAVTAVAGVVLAVTIIYTQRLVNLTYIWS